MQLKRNFLYTLLEVICVVLVVFGLGQNWNAIGRWQYEIMNDWSLVGIFMASVIAIGVVVTLFWHRSDPNRASNVHNGLQTIIALYVCHMICNYAFAKLLKTQFQPPNYVLDTPIGELNGFWLTWTYFGFSETFAYILGWTQVVGGVLILFRKTRLLGAFILIPVLVNIDLIDHFYSISPLAYYNALHYTFMLFFFLILDSEKLMDLFFSAKETLSSTSWKFWALNVIRVLVIGYAFYKIYDLKSSFEPKSKLNGTWKVDKMNLAGKDLSTDNNASPPWDKLYIEWRYGLLARYDPHLPLRINDEYGGYTVDEDKSELNIHLSSASPEVKGDSLLVQYKFVSDSTLTLTGLYNKDSVHLRLTKLK